MRSDLVFEANTKVPNRFMLCRMVSVSAGQIRRNGEAMGSSINRSLTLVETPADKPVVVAPQPTIDILHL